MKLGITIPNNWGLEDPQDVLNIAVKAEELGFDSVWVNHHVFNAGYIYERLGHKPYYDALTTLTYAGAMTKRVRLGTTILVLPYLNPIVLAKELATLDVYSGGRVIVGVGVGALKAESDALGSDYHTRGRYADESLAVMKELWTQDVPSFSGRFFQFSGAPFSPKPLQKPHPPLWIGGTSDAALRRVARLGDGWHPNRMSADSMRESLAKLQVQLDEQGRSMDEITLSIRAEVNVLTAPSANGDEPLVGTPLQISEGIKGFEELGVEEIVMQIGSLDAKHINQVMEDFADKVMPLVR
ncbi:MAG: LLM class flavin-dependent oxidoreductase [Chloroflexi bacterium]|nr:LLM class flavin-dependent oxidoreductase [Chloroflexota bacterium]